MNAVGFFENLPRKFHYLLIGLLIGLLGAVGALLFRHQMNGGIEERVIEPADPEASLTIRNFRHNAVKDGRRQWSLSAETAGMYAKQDLVRLKGITARFYTEDGQTVTLNADEGTLRLDNNHIAVSGGVTVEMPRYLLESESLQYNNETNIIRTDQPVTVIAPSGRLTADTMTYSMNTQILICEGNVKGILHDADLP